MRQQRAASHSPYDADGDKDGSHLGPDVGTQHLAGRGGSCVPVGCMARSCWPACRVPGAAADVGGAGGATCAVVAAYAPLIMVAMSSPEFGPTVKGWS